MFGTFAHQSCCISYHTHGRHQLTASAGAAAANIACGKYLAALLLAPLCVDITGTAQILFVTTKQFESAILTDGRDITSLILVCFLSFLM